MTEQLQVKVSWKIGNIELQYEGNQSFLKTELPKLFQELLEIYKSGSNNGELEQPEFPPMTEKLNADNLGNKKLELSVNTIATKLGITEGRDFALAACAYLSLVEQKPTFSYDDIREAMKSAHHFYDENQRKNLPKYVASLMKEDWLLERSPRVYALSSGKLNELRTALLNEGTGKLKEDTPKKTTTSRVSRANGKSNVVVDHAKIIEKIKTCEEANVIDQNILSRSSQIGKALLSLYIVHEYFGNEFGLTSGDISKITKDLGIPIAVGNASNVLSGNAKMYVIGDKVRKKGEAVRYKLHKRGVDYMKKVIAGASDEVEE